MVWQTIKQKWHEIPKMAKVALYVVLGIATVSSLYQLAQHLQ